MMFLYLDVYSNVMAKTDLSKAIDMMVQALDPENEANFTILPTESKLNLLAPLIIEMAKAIERMEASKN